MTNSVEFRYGKDVLTIGTAIRLAEGKTKGLLTPETRAKLLRISDVVEAIVKQDRIVPFNNRLFLLLL